MKLKRLLFPPCLAACLVPCIFTSLVSATPTFGVETFTTSIQSNVEGAPATQAGSHPYALSATIIFNHQVSSEEETFKENLGEEEVPLGEPEVFARIYGNPRHLEVNLPAGLIVNPSATTVKCTEAQLESNQSSGGGCPAASAVGVVTVYINGFGAKIKGAVYNMVPPPGVPAELGLDPGEVGVVLHIAGKLRSDGDYGFSAAISEIGQTVSIYGLGLTLWGDPSAPSHDPQRGVCAASGPVRKSIEREFSENEFKKKGASTREYRFSCPTERADTPLLTLPGACTAQPFPTTLSVNSWQQPAKQQPPPATSPPVTGCEALQFNPTLEVTPTPEASSTTSSPAPAPAESPTGLSVDLKIPHQESVATLAAADLKQLTVTLPQGMAISLSAANGLAACSEEQIGLKNANPVACPDASKIGATQVLTPLLEKPLAGSVYLAQPHENPFGSSESPGGSLLALYLVAEGNGVLIKLAGNATLDPNTGQITLAFNDAPQLPLQEIRLNLFAGPRAVLQTPPACGTYRAAASLLPWSSETPVSSNSSFAIVAGPNGSPCPSSPLPFLPSFTAGTTNSQAGAFSPLNVAFSRDDGEQPINAIAVRMPPGLLGVLRNVALCPEPRAAAGQCSQASAIGTATVAAGSGQDPLYLPQAGQPPNTVYLTGPYEGAPFGLSIVIPEIAGPFNLGDVILRAKVEVDPHTAQITITSDPLPSIRDGIPLDIRAVRTYVDRPNFMFNPTSCAPQALAGTISSSQGSSSHTSSTFQATGCTALSFRPKLSALTHANASRADGAYLHIKVASGPTQANIAKVKVDLPQQLPSRLTTLQRACPAPTFRSNPGGCPTASVVGMATVATPMLAQPLIGPAYLLSHGQAAFPTLVLVLQSEGILIDLEGQTSISHGVTSAAFKALPDAPITTFDLVLAAGPHSLLAPDQPAKAKRVLCAQTLNMPTALTGQNGTVLKQDTRIVVSGCVREAKAHAKGKQTHRK
jgi:hypothetical protein